MARAKSTSWRVRGALAGLTLALVLGACGSYGETPGSGPSTTTASAPAPEPTAGPTGPDGPQRPDPPAGDPGGSPGFHQRALVICDEVTKSLEDGDFNVGSGPNASYDEIALSLSTLSTELRAIDPPRSLVPSLDRIDELVAEYAADPKSATLGPNASLTKVGLELTVIGNGLRSAGLMHCGA